jgi:hypothetical protein
MRPRLAAPAAAAILIAGTSAVHADILCAVELGYLKDVLRDRPGPACPFGERLLDPAAIGLQRLPEPQDAPTGMPIDREPPAKKQDDNWLPSPAYI